MDDLFSAFDATAPALSSVVLPAAAPASAPTSAAHAGKKRPREDDHVAQQPHDGHSADASHHSHEHHAHSAHAAPSASKRKAVDIIGAIEASARMDLDPRRNERLQEYDAVPPEEEGAGSGAGAGAGAAASASAGAAQPVARGGAGGPASASPSAASALLPSAGAAPGHSASSASSSGGASGGSSSNTIGEALRSGPGPAPTRGDIVGSRTTAPIREMPTDRPPAREYPFTLDPFQKAAIGCLEHDESVLVSAHTSAGKTVVAEYAIAMALRDNQRVIYTSPIKALSNQKYRDLYEIFNNVGLMTGDVTINPHASCLVMTTEILRSMLYRGSEVMREVKWVIFDEIHYMRDAERGVVWEESIIMLPHKVRFVFLSATIPNSSEFAEWIAKIHHQRCHVVYTDYRPTPLQHFIFPAGADGVHLVVDEKGNFKEDVFNKAMAILGTSSLEDAVDDVLTKGGGKKASAKKMGRNKGGPSDLYRIMKMIMDKGYDPVIVFSFSKRECETYALALSKMDFTTPDSKRLIEQIFLNAMESLGDDDKALPQIDAILPLLKRGIGIHHGGLLPILKEVIEILFQESLLKVLFATETFSMGINMPARTVIFTASRKFDGTDFRWISAGEYIQMSGRAGRRGLDDRGIVIQMIDEAMEPAAAKDILKGTADPLNSAFHVGYNMLLNLLRVEGGDPERMMALSFHQYQSERAAPQMEAELAKQEEAMAALVIADEAAVAEYFSLCAAMESVREAILKVMMAPEHALPFLQPGRLVRVADGAEDWGWGIVVNFQKRVAAEGALGNAGEDDGEPAPEGSAGGSAAARGKQTVVVVEVLLHCAPDAPSSSGGSSGGAGAGAGAGAKKRRPRPASADEIATDRAELRVVPLVLPLITAISTLRVYIPKDLLQASARRTMSDRLKETHRRFPDGVPLLDPIADMRISGTDFTDLVARSAALQERIAANPVHKAPDRNDRFTAYKKKLEISERCKFLRDRIKQCKSLVMKDTMQKMKRLLRRLGHINAENVVQLKGRVACEVNTADELLVTELIFNGVFNDLNSAQSAALLSCLVYTEKSSADEDAPKLPEELAGPLRALQDAARRIAQASQDSRLELDTEEYVSSFNPGMMPLVYAWVQGAKFVDVCGMTKQFEGTIIRVIRRLEELCRQLSDAARSIGDEALEAKFKEASTKMRRDIIFAASLYL